MTILLTQKHPVFAARGLLTAKVLYPMPDYPNILQTFVHQGEDEYPTLPRFWKFLAHWRECLIVQPHSVTYWFQPEGGAYRRVDHEIVYN